MTALSTTRYELFYFDSPGRAEVIRFLLQYAKANWSERHPTTWSEERSDTPFGFLPVLVEYQEDGSEFKLGESHAIERYLARKFGLIGSNEYEAALIDSFAEGWASLIDILVQILHSKSDAEKETFRLNFKNSAAELIKYHEKQLSRNGNGYYVGANLSLVDLLAYATIKLVKSTGNPVFDNAPGFSKLLETVENHPVIGSYVRERLSAHKKIDIQTTTEQ